MAAKQKIIVVVGPTASGKTALAIALAKQFSGEVISADSRQVYRGLDIGTEKVSTDEMEHIPHHLIDIVDVATVYSAADFKRDAMQAIEHIASRGALPIVAGGTFFYVDTLLGTAPLPAVSPDDVLRAELAQQSPETLFAALERLDPTRAATIDPHNKRRLIRALEIVKTLGHVPAQHASEQQYDVLMIGIAVEKDMLRERIRQRALHAVERGLIAETQQLLNDGVTTERLSEIGLEYPLVIEHLAGTLSMEELVQKLEEKNWQYAKRQLTWLKRMEKIHWISAGDTEGAIAATRAFLSQSV